MHQTCVKEETQPEVDCTASNGAAETNDNTPATLVGPTWEMTKQNYDEAKKTVVFIDIFRYSSTFLVHFDHHYFILDITNFISPLVT